MNYFAYLARVRTLEVVHTGNAAATIYSELTRFEVNTLVAVLSHPVVQSLNQSESFKRAGEFTFCGQRFAAFEVAAAVPAD